MHPYFYISIISIIFFIAQLYPAMGQSTYQLAGKVIDESNQNPVSFAQVAVYPPGGTTPITGATTEDNGQFKFDLKQGKYDVEIVFVGYESKRISGVEVTTKNKNLGQVSLLPSTKQLDEVVVKSQAIRRPVSTDMEGLNIRPDQTLSNVGGSLLDVLRNSPSVNVSDDGTVSLRGSSGTNILIDGRNSVLASDLEQLPASMIKNIKIVNNPNAKYDAQGAGGVINIQLKKGANQGTSGKVETTVGTRLRANGSLNLGHRSDNFNIYGGYSIRRWPRVGSSSTIRETFDNFQRLEQEGEQERNDLEHTISFGTDFFFGKNKLSYEGAFNMEDETDSEAVSTELFDTRTEDLLLKYTRLNTETEDNYSLDNALIYERLFNDDSGKEFRALITHSFRDQLENQNINVYSGAALPGESDPTGMERSNNDENNENLILQADYVHPLGNGKFEAGYKSTFRKLDNDYTYEVLNQQSGAWTNQENVSNRFIYKDQIHAAYLIYSHTFNKFEISGGTRLEQTMVDTRLYNTSELNEQNYLNLFPSVQSQYHLDDLNAVKFTYSRRIDRPGSRHLNPFPDISDSLNVRIGNPNLQPEFINSFELGHMVKFKKADITSNLFYRHVNGQVDYIVSVENGISYRQPTNLNTSVTYGLEIINSTQLFPWWSFNASYSLFQTEVDGSNLDSGYSNKGISWNAKMTTDFNLPYEIDLQLTGKYEAPEIEAQGRDLARYSMDMSVQRSFFKDKASLTLTVRDVFNTQRFAGENFGTNFRQSFEYKRESRIALVNLSYTF